MSKLTTFLFSGALLCLFAAVGLAQYPYPTGQPTDCTAYGYACMDTGSCYDIHGTQTCKTYVTNNETINITYNAIIHTFRLKNGQCYPSDPTPGAPPCTEKKFGACNREFRSRSPTNPCAYGTVCGTVRPETSGCDPD